MLDDAKAALDAHYGAELGEPFRTAGLCLYRDGRDSVAWHGDRIGRGRNVDTMVAIISVGSPRALLLRPRGGGRTIRHELGHGDLIVMGGSCQRTWDHSIPKTAKAGRAAHQHSVPAARRALTRLALGVRGEIWVKVQRVTIIGPAGVDVRSGVRCRCPLLWRGGTVSQEASNMRELRRAARAGAGQNRHSSSAR